MKRTIWAALGAALLFGGPEAALEAVPPLDSVARDAWIEGAFDNVHRQLALIESRLDDEGDQDPPSSAEPDRREGLLVQCAGWPRTPDNPLGLRAEQHRSLADARAFYRSQYDRAAERGVMRVVWHMLAGYSGTADDPDDHRGAAAVLGAMAQRRVPVYEHLGFYDLPGAEVQATGALRMPMIHNAHVRVSGQRDADWLDISPEKVAEAVARLRLGRHYNGPLVIDYEPYVQGWRHERTVAAYLTVLSTVRAELPNAQVAFFGLPHVRYRKPDGTTELLSIDMVRPVLEQVDFIAPQHYSGRVNWTERMAEREREKMRESRSFGKPVIPFISPRAVQPRKGQWLDAAALVERARVLIDEGAEAIVVWDTVQPPQPPDLERRFARAVQQVMQESTASRARVWREETHRFLARHPRATVGVAISPFVPFSTESTDISEYRGYEVYDHDNPAHYRMLVNEIIQPLVLAGVTEIWFDRGPADSFGPDITALCAHLHQRFNLRCVLYPPAVDSLGEIDRDALRIVPAAAPSGWLETRREIIEAAAESEVHVIVTPGGTAPDGAKLTTWRERGLVLWSGDPSFDEPLWPSETGDGQQRAEGGDRP